MKNREQLIKGVKTYIKSEQEFGLKAYHSKTGSDPVFGTDSLKAFHDSIKNCRECELARGRTNIVVGEGSPNAQLVFIGEAPGFEEDRQGRPFVGRSGKLLTKMIEAMGFKREDVFICNVLKCRPPQNRDPLPTEVAICRSYFMRQIEIIKPRVICCLGRHAVHALLQDKRPISSLRGKFLDFAGTKVMPTFHPAYLLRNPRDKNLAWQDLQKIMKELRIKN